MNRPASRFRLAIGTRIAAGLAAAALALGADAHAALDSEQFVAVEPGPPAGKAASAQSLAARATVTPSATVYGAFELRSSAVVYILVRGPSLATLGVTSNGLDAPWVRVFDGNGRDLVNTNLSSGGTIVGAGRCNTTSTLDKPVIDYYQLVRNAPVHERDSCIATGSLPAGAYTFSITPSIPGVTSPTSLSSSPTSGEILFEVTLGPSAPVADTNYTRTERLVGGTWTFTYHIGSSRFVQSYSFTSIVVSASAGDYDALGRDQFGDPVVGTYNSRTGLWGVFDPSVILDRFFTFTYSDLNHVAGCYYQLSPPGSTTLGSCYPMTGVRSPFKAFAASTNPLEKDLEEVAAAQAAEAVQIGPRILDAPSDSLEVLRGITR